VSTGTGIGYVDDTLVLVTGCKEVSAGCDNCFAATLTSGRLAHLPQYHGLAVAGKFTGEVRCHPERLLIPLRQRKGRRIFVCDMGDLFHPGVPDLFIARTFAMMALSPQHAYLILTKRHARMRVLLSSREFRDAALGAMAQLAQAARLRDGGQAAITAFTWPLPNVHLVVSVESQQWARIRIPALLATPAAVRGVSAEPLLERVTLAHWLGREVWANTAGPGGGVGGQALTPGPGIDWVVTGGESGKGARPPHPDWFRLLRDECGDARVPFYFKQWGSWAPWQPGPRGAERHLGDRTGPRAAWVTPEGETHPWDYPAAYAANRVWALMEKTGKAAAGHTLDGRTHTELPAAAAGPPESAPMAAG
jgi:protein gp37